MAFFPASRAFEMSCFDREEKRSMSALLCFALSVD